MSEQRNTAKGRGRVLGPRDILIGISSTLRTRAGFGPVSLRGDIGPPYRHTSQAVMAQAWSCFSWLFLPFLLHTQRTCLKWDFQALTSEESQQFHPACASSPLVELSPACHPGGGRGRQKEGHLWALGHRPWCSYLWHPV
jgi:hypothetical protein